jgi:hypothetical protein
MATNSSINLQVTRNADGFDLSGGTTPRKLTLTGADVTVTGSGGATITFPASSATVATLTLNETLTNKTLTTPAINTPTISGAKFAVAIKTTTYQALATDGTIYVDSTGGAFTVTLPAISGNTGLRLRFIKKAGAAAVTLDGNAAETIEGNLTVDLAANNQVYELETDGTQWYIVGN